LTLKVLRGEGDWAALEKNATTNGNLGGVSSTPEVVQRSLLGKRGITGKQGGKGGGVKKGFF